MRFTKLFEVLLVLAAAFALFFLPHSMITPILLVISSSVTTYRAYLAKRPGAAGSPFDRETLRLF